MNRGELRDFIKDLGKRSDSGIDTLVNGFITQAEELIATRVRAREMLGNPYSLGEAQRESGGRYTLPTDFLGIFGIASSEGWPCRPRTFNELRAYAANAGAYFYTVYGFNIEFRGAPAEDSTFDVIYFARPAAMTQDTDEPLLLTNQSNLYIQAAMFYYRLWSEDPELASAHFEAFGAEAEAVNELAGQDAPAETGPSTNLGHFSHRSPM